MTSENNTHHILDESFEITIIMIRSRLNLTSEYSDKRITKAIYAVKAWSKKYNISDHNRIWEEITYILTPEFEVEGSHRGNSFIISEIQYNGSGKY